MTEEEFNSFGWRGNIAGKLISERTEPDPHPRWNAPNEIATNSSGFNALPGETRVGDPNYDELQDNSFRKLGKEAVFWSGVLSSTLGHPNVQLRSTLKNCMY